MSDFSPDRSVSAAPGGSDEGFGPPTPSGASRTSKSRSAVACLQCRQSKLKCDYTSFALLSPEGHVKCSRCIRLSQECVVVPAVKGRKPGAKNRPKDYREGGGSNPGSRRSSLSSSKSAASDHFAASAEGSFDFAQGGAAQPMASSFMPLLFDLEQPVWPQASPSPYPAAELPPRDVHSPQDDRPPDYSDWQQTPHMPQMGMVGAWQQPPPNSYAPKLVVGDTAHMAMRTPAQVLQAGLDELVQETAMQPAVSPVAQPSARASPVRPDVGHNLGPVSCGILDVGSMRRLVHHFFSDTNYSLPLLDDNLHTMDLLCHRSALLSTAVALLAAQRLQTSLMPALARHVEYLRDHVRRNACRSIEIVQALCLLGAFGRLGNDSSPHSAALLMEASTMALELNLDREVEEANLRPLSSNPHAAREARNRKRTMISLFTWDRNVAMLRLRNHALALQDDFIIGITDFDKHPLATAGDPLLVQQAMLAYEACMIRRAIFKQQARSGIATIPALVTNAIRERLLKRYQESNSKALVSRQFATLSLTFHATCALTYQFALPFVSLIKNSGDGSAQALEIACRRACIEACEVITCFMDPAAMLTSVEAQALASVAELALSLQQSVPPDGSFTALLGLLAHVLHFLQREVPNEEVLEGFSRSLKAAVSAALLDSRAVATAPPPQMIMPYGVPMVTGSHYPNDQWP